VTSAQAFVETLPPAERKEAVAALKEARQICQTILTPCGAKARSAVIFNKPELSECSFDGDLPDEMMRITLLLSGWRIWSLIRGGAVETRRATTAGCWCRQAASERTLE
jgi:hypothetical protein